MVDREELKRRLLAISARAPAEDQMELTERLLTICERISNRAYGTRDSEPEHSITRKLCYRDAAWLADYVLRLLANSQEDK